MRSMAKFVRALFIRDREERARRFVAIARDEPNSFTALLWGAREAWNCGAPDEALPLAERGLAIEPNSLSLLVIPAGVYAEREQKELAYGYARRILNARRIDHIALYVGRILLFPLFAVPRFRRKIIGGSRRLVSDYDEWVTWAGEYVEWCEGANGRS